MTSYLFDPSQGGNESEFYSSSCDFVLPPSHSYVLNHHTLGSSPPTPLFYDPTSPFNSFPMDHSHHQHHHHTASHNENDENVLKNKLMGIGTDGGFLTSPMISNDYHSHNSNRSSRQTQSIHEPRRSSRRTSGGNNNNNNKAAGSTSGGISGVENVVGQNTGKKRNVLGNSTSSNESDTNNLLGVGLGYPSLLPNLSMSQSTGSRQSSSGTTTSNTKNGGTQPRRRSGRLHAVRNRNVSGISAISGFSGLSGLSDGGLDSSFDISIDNDGNGEGSADQSFDMGQMVRQMTMQEQHQHLESGMTGSGNMDGMGISGIFDTNTTTTATTSFQSQLTSNKTVSSTTLTQTTFSSSSRAKTPSPVDDDDDDDEVMIITAVESVPPVTPKSRPRTPVKATPSAFKTGSSSKTLPPVPGMATHTNSRVRATRVYANAFEEEEGNDDRQTMSGVDGGNQEVTELDDVSQSPSKKKSMVPSLSSPSKQGAAQMEGAAKTPVSRGGLSSMKLTTNAIMNSANKLRAAVGLGQNDSLALVNNIANYKQSNNSTDTAGQVESQGGSNRFVEHRFKEEDVPPSTPASAQAETTSEGAGGAAEAGGVRGGKVGSSTARKTKRDGMIIKTLNKAKSSPALRGSPSTITKSTNLATPGVTTHPVIRSPISPSPFHQQTYQDSMQGMMSNPSAVTFQHSNAMQQQQHLQQQQQNQYQQRGDEYPLTPTSAHSAQFNIPGVPYNSPLDGVGNMVNINSEGGHNNTGTEPQIAMPFSFADLYNFGLAENSIEVVDNTNLIKGNPNLFSPFSVNNSNGRGAGAGHLNGLANQFHLSQGAGRPLDETDYNMLHSLPTPYLGHASPFSSPSSGSYYSDGHTPELAQMSLHKSDGGGGGPPNDPYSEQQQQQIGGRQRCVNYSSRGRVQQPTLQQQQQQDLQLQKQQQQQQQQQLQQQQQQQQRDLAVGAYPPKFAYPTRYVEQVYSVHVPQQQQVRLLNPHQLQSSPQHSHRVQQQQQQQQQAWGTVMQPSYSNTTTCSLDTNNSTSSSSVGGYSSGPGLPLLPAGAFQPQPQPHHSSIAMDRQEAYSRNLEAFDDMMSRSYSTSTAYSTPNLPPNRPQQQQQQQQQKQHKRGRATSDDENEDDFGERTDGDLEEGSYVPGGRLGLGVKGDPGIDGMGLPSPGDGNTGAESTRKRLRTVASAPCLSPARRMKPGPKPKKSPQAAHQSVFSASILSSPPPMPRRRFATTSPGGGGGAGDADSDDEFGPGGGSSGHLSSGGSTLPKELIQSLYKGIPSHIGEDGVKIAKKYECLMAGCGRFFPRKSAIESHIQTHLEDKPFMCTYDDCDASFVRQHDLRRHERIHSGNKPFPCPCGKGFARGDALARHRSRGICSGSIVPRRS